MVGDSKQMPPTSFAEPSAGDDDDESVESNDFLLQDEESILAECVQARVERQFLSWHYRSQDESLIAFSNRYYYDEQLTSFPAPAHGQVDAGIDGHGISLVRVNGQFLRSGSTKELRTNPVEAEAIVAEVQQRFDASTDATPSVGVITFNAQQRTLIEALLRDSGDERIAEALEAKDGLFVKNLENVQGDERDTILFSTAFSKNDRGVLPLNFGPLTNYGGERRLNVAITRARRQVIMFSSFDPQDLRADETTSRGIKDLRAYLELAQKGPQQTLRARSGPLVTDRHRDEIAAALRERGLSVQTDVGLSDFKVDLVVATADDPDEPVLAILLDGVAWSQRRTVADRDALPIEVLEGLMHWPAVERVWLPEWLDDSAAVVERLEATTKDAVRRVEEAAAAEAEAVATATDGSRSNQPAEVTPATSVRLLPTETTLAPVAGSIGVAPSLTPPPPTPPRVVPRASTPALTGETTDDVESSVTAMREYEPVSARAAALTMDRPVVDVPASADPDMTPFTPWRPRVAGSIEVLDDWRRRANLAAIQEIVLEIVDAEGPVQSVRLAKLVASAFGLNKVSGPRILTVLECLPNHLERTSDENFVWPTDLDPEEWTGFRPVRDGSSRALETISNRELANAMADLVRRAAGMPEEELLRATLGVFGGVRLTTAIRGRLVEALRFAEGRGRVARGTGDLIVAGTGSRPTNDDVSSPAPLPSARLAAAATLTEEFDPSTATALLDAPTARLATTGADLFLSWERRKDVAEDRFFLVDEPIEGADTATVAVYNGSTKLGYLEAHKAGFYSRCLQRLGSALEVAGELSYDSQWFVHVPQKKAFVDFLDEREK
ncbi:AAA domain-containing protein [Frondihabitans peucedani]|uniref:AAA domain-containing protein n=1 Tax=Frondihabitans peucedani TaxID=598626 RepID=UPI0031D7D43A